MATKLIHNSEYVISNQPCKKCGHTVETKPLYIIVSNEHDLSSDKHIRKFECGIRQEWICPKCGNKIYTQGPFTYFNTANKIILHPIFRWDYQSEKQLFIRDIVRVFKESGISVSVGSNGEFSYDGYQARACKNYTDFGEKVCIARYDMDDRPMEIVKYYMNHDFLPKEYPGKNVYIMWFQGAGFRCNNGVEGMQFHIYNNGKEEDINIAAEVYYSACNALDKLGFMTSENEGLVVNQDWASKLYPHVSGAISKLMTAKEHAAYIAAQRAAAQRAAAAPARRAPVYHSGSASGTYQSAAYTADSSYDNNSSYGNCNSDQSSPNASAQRYNYERASNEGGSDGYNTVMVDGQKTYYTGDYRPFGSEGDSYHYDDGYTPMSE